METGEALTIRHIETNEFIKVKNEIKYRLKNKDNGTKYIKWLCQRNRQIKLEL